MNQLNIINHYSYYDVDTFSTLANKTKDCFTVLRTNIQSISSKVSEFELFIAELKHVDFKFSSIVCKIAGYLKKMIFHKFNWRAIHVYIKVKGVVQVVV